MELTRIANGNCTGDDCPAVFTTDRNSIVVQGYVVDLPTTPDGEGTVEIPFSVFQEAIRALGE